MLSFPDISFVIILFVFQRFGIKSGFPFVFIYKLYVYSSTKLSADALHIPTFISWLLALISASSFSSFSHLIFISASCLRHVTRSVTSPPCHPADPSDIDREVILVCIFYKQLINILFILKYYDTGVFSMHSHFIIISHKN